MNTDFPRRLAAALEERGLTQASLAHRAGVNPSSVSHWVTGRREPDLDTINSVAGFLGVSPAWLAFGDGEMVDGPATDPADAPDDAPTLRAPVVVRDGFDQSAEATVATASELDGTPPLERAEPTRSSKAPRRGGAAAA